MVSRSFAERMRNAEHLLGTVLSFPSPEVAEALALCGYDWLLVDVAAAPIDTLCAQRIQQAARCPVLIRVAETSASAIHHALDTGATGLILPGIRCAADVEQVIAACRYPPLGKRAVGMARAQGYGHNLKTYIDDANEEIVIVPQVDHIDAVREIEAIAAVSGFNALFIEPQGIAASLGYPGQISHSEVSAAISRVQHICDDAERRTGICVQDLNGAARWMGENLTLLAVSSDAMMMSQRARDVLQVLR